MLWAIVGFLLGMSVGAGDARSRLVKKLGAFAEARGLRIVDRDGNDVPVSELLAATPKQ